jgi:sec-independent protein translocase protein TatC
MSSNGVPDPDDFFADTRMSFADHIEDLRTHLWRAIKGFGVAVVLSFCIGHIVLAYITAPVKDQLHEFWKRRIQNTVKDLENNSTYKVANQPTQFVPMMFYGPQLRAFLEGKDTKQFKRPVLPAQQPQAAQEKSLWEKVFGNDKTEEADPNSEVISEDKVVTLWVAHGEPLREMALMQEALRVVGDFDTMSTLNIMEGFSVWFKVCIICGLVLGSPWIFWQLWSFVAAGLYPHEKRYVHVYLPISLGLFLGGVALCEIFVIPKAIEALLWFNEWLGFKPDLRLNEWLGFAIFMPVIFGLSFQTPLVMLFLGKLGIVDARTFQSKRRYAWFFLAVFAAVITPSTDAVSMLFLWIPMSLLFELGIWLIKMSRPHTDLDVDVPDPEDMVEV